MSDGGPAEFGFASPHPEALDPGFAVAPTRGDQQKNTIQLQLVAIACWRLDRAVFDFDSSVVRPEIAGELRRLKALVESNPGAPASVFGHADPSGSDDYNKKLSGRRARAIYALLIRDTDAWEELFSKPEGGDSWGLASTQRMLGHLQRPAGGAYYTGTVDGKFGALTERAIKDFQGDNGLKVAGDAVPNTRKQLYTVYMDAVCVGPGEAFVMKKEDFLGKGADPGAKGDLQGCSEFNPILLFSEEEEKAFARSGDKRTRDAENAPNRRVLIFLFRRGLPLQLADWPCPTITEGTGKCQAQFFPDGDQRRKPGAERRRYGDERNTMACRFYDRFARSSPCEAGPALIGFFNEEQTVKPSQAEADPRGPEDPDPINPRREPVPADESF